MQTLIVVTEENDFCALKDGKEIPVKITDFSLKASFGVCYRDFMRKESENVVIATLADLKAHRVDNCLEELEGMEDAYRKQLWGELFTMLTKLTDDGWSINYSEGSNVYRNETLLEYEIVAESTEGERFVDTESCINFNTSDWDYQLLVKTLHCFEEQF